MRKCNTSLNRTRKWLIENQYVKPDGKTVIGGIKNLRKAEAQLRKFALDSFKVMPEMMNYNNIFSINKNSGITIYKPFFEWVDREEIKRDTIKESHSRENGMPLGNNYEEFIRYKQDRLENLKEEIVSLEFMLRNNNTSDVVNINKRIREITKERRIIHRQLEQLKKNKPELMFHAITEDLDIFEETLKDIDTANLEDIKNKLEFYKEFLEGKSKAYKADSLNEYDSELFNPISGRVTNLLTRIEQDVFLKVRKQIIEAEDVQELIKEMNKDEDKVFTQHDLFNASKDINFLEAYFLGVTADRTNNTIIPQMMYKIHNSALRKNQDYVDRIKNRLNKLIEENPSFKNPDFIKEVDEKGSETGYIVHMFSPRYFKNSRGYYKKLSAYFKNPTDKTYMQVISEFISHNELIDFTKIKEVKDIYGDQYFNYFNSSEEEMIQYEKELKDKLGPLYQETIDQILSRLAVFEDSRQEALNSESSYANRDLAGQDLWQFNRLIQEGVKFSNLHIYYPFNGGQAQTFFTDFSNLTYIPKTTINGDPVMINGIPQVEKENSNYYSKQFQEILKDPKKLEYWHIMKELSEYIASTYNQTDYGRLSYPKIQQEYATRIGKVWKDKGIMGIANIGSETLKEWKSFFYEKRKYREDTGEVNANYRDTFKGEVSRLSKIYEAQGIGSEEAYRKARQEILDIYKGDFNASIMAVAMEAALHNARVEVNPVMKSHLDLFKGINDGRKKAIQKLEYYYGKVILNQTNAYRGTKKTEGKDIGKGSWLERLVNLLELIPSIKKYVNNKSLSFLSDSEKLLLKELNRLKKQGSPRGEYSFIRVEEDVDIVYSKIEIDGEYKYYEGINNELKEISKETFDKSFKEKIDQDIDKLGLDLSLAGVIDGILKTKIFQGLALNPISGIFNRIEGKHSSMIMDVTGEYWTPGNIQISNNIMSFANILRMSRGRIPIKNLKTRETLEIFEDLVKHFNILQDRKNELQRSAEESSFNNDLLNPFLMAVENPEFKNQGAIMLAVMMDFEIENSKGEKVPFLDKKTGQFNKEFLDSKNLPNFSDKLQNKLVMKMTDAVSRSQGNYNVQDIMLAKKTIWGRAATLFKTWQAEHINQRFGVSGDKNVNLATGKRRRDGRFVEAYKTNKFNTTVAGVIGFSTAYGFGVPLFALAGLGGISFFVYKKFMKKIASPKEVRRDINYALEFAEFLKSVLIESLNYPGKMLNFKGDVIFNSSFEKTNMTREEIGSMRALTRELAIILSWLMVKLLMGALLFDDDDDEMSPKRMKHNFIQNQLSRAINALIVYTDPKSLIDDQSRFSLIDTIHTIQKVLLGVFDDNLRQDLGKNVLDLTPVPRILTKNRLPWHDKTNYDTLSDFSKIPGTMKWTHKLYKSWDTEGNSESKKEYLDIRKKMRESYKKEFMSITKGNKKVLKVIVSQLMKENLGKKPSDKDYNQIMKDIKETGKIQTKKKASRKQRDATKEKLKGLGLTNEEIREIMSKMYKDR